MLCREQLPERFGATPFEQAVLPKETLGQHRQQATLRNLVNQGVCSSCNVLSSENPKKPRVQAAMQSMQHPQINNQKGASQCTPLHHNAAYFKTAGRELRASQRRPKPNHHTTALAKGRASRSLAAPKRYKVPHPTTGGLRTKRLGPPRASEVRQPHRLKTPESQWSPSRLLGGSPYIVFSEAMATVGVGAKFASRFSMPSKSRFLFSIRTKTVALASSESLALFGADAVFDKSKFRAERGDFSISISRFG